MNKASSTRGFTLIELLVVIAIIAILAAILFPVFASAKEAAKKTVDLSNQKQIATATMLYGSDFDDMYPRAVYKRTDWKLPGWNPPYTWREAVQPYAKAGNKGYGNSSVANVGQIQLADGGMWDTPAMPGNRGAYTMNRILSPGMCYWFATGGGWVCDSEDDGTPRPSTAPMPSVSQTALDAPASILMTYTVGIHPTWKSSGDYSESSPWWWGGEQWPPVFSGPTSHEKYDADSTVAPSYGMPRYRYAKGLNSSFADGHAKYTKKGALNWCKFVYAKGLESDKGENWATLYDPGQPCAAFAR